MARRLSVIALFTAWLFASGAMLDGVQVFAWARMFTGYALAMPVGEAAVETLDPQKPCPICRAVRRAREESKGDRPLVLAAAAGKLVLVLHEIGPVVFARETERWPASVTIAPTSWRDPVPVPPPRRFSACLFS